MGRRRWFGSKKWDQKNVDISCSGSGNKFTYASLQAATNNFSDNRYIGEGGFAQIYKGVLPDGRVVAVKTYHDRTLCRHGIKLLQMAEVMSSEIRHRNINRVIGYCNERNSFLLVCEYVENGDLLGLLQDPERRKSSFEWHKRVDVCIGIARGICYLHQDTDIHVIHRDIKPSNILLDINLTPKITDFDLGGLFRDSNELPLEDLVVGTYGYLDPEYLSSGKYTEKVDVYSFGLVILEVISGRKALDREVENRDDGVIMRWVLRLAQSGRALEAVDPMLSELFPADEARRLIDVALLCTQMEGRLRPSMHQVMLMLQGICNSCMPMPPLTMFHMSTDYYETHFPIATSVEDEGETNANLTESNSEAQSQADPDGISAQDQTVTGSRLEQANTATVSEVAVVQQKQKPMWMQKKKMKPGNVLSGSGDVAERLSQTMVFKKKTCPEAVYPPYHTRVFRKGSRNLYSFDF